MSRPWRIEFKGAVKEFRDQMLKNGSIKKQTNRQSIWIELLRGRSRGKISER